MQTRARVDVAIDRHTRADASPVVATATSFASRTVARAAAGSVESAARSRVAARISFERAIADIPAENVRCIMRVMRSPSGPSPPLSQSPPMVVMGFSPAMQYFAASFVSLAATAPVAALAAAASAPFPPLIDAPLFDAQVQRISDAAATG